VSQTTFASRIFASKHRAVAALPAAHARPHARHDDGHDPAHRADSLAQLYPARRGGTCAANKNRVTPRKLFIVARGNADIFVRALNAAVLYKFDVEIISDRRKADGPVRRDGEERRIRSDVDARLRTEGYAAVRFSSERFSGDNSRCSYSGVLGMFHRENPEQTFD